MESEKSKLRSFINALFWVGIGMGFSSFFFDTNISFNGVDISRKIFWFIYYLFVIPDLYCCVKDDLNKDKSPK